MKDDDDDDDQDPFAAFGSDDDDDDNDDDEERQNGLVGDEGDVKKKFKPFEMDQQDEAHKNSDDIGRSRSLQQQDLYYKEIAVAFASALTQQFLLCHPHHHYKGINDNNNNNNDKTSNSSNKHIARHSVTAPVDSRPALATLKDRRLVLVSSSVLLPGCQEEDSGTQQQQQKEEDDDLLLLQRALEQAFAVRSMSYIVVSAQDVLERRRQIQENDSSTFPIIPSPLGDILLLLVTSKRNGSSTSISSSSSSAQQEIVGSQQQQELFDMLVPGGALWILETTSKAASMNRLVSWDLVLDTFLWRTKTTATNTKATAVMVKESPSLIDAEKSIRVDMSITDYHSHSSKHNDDDVAVTVTCVHRWMCQVQTFACPWLPRHRVRLEAAAAVDSPTRNNHNNNTMTAALQEEFHRIQSACVPLSLHECQTGRLSTWSIQKAVLAMEQAGYCILPRFFVSQEHILKRWKLAVLDDLHEAAKRLKVHGTCLYQPLESTVEPASYRELSMREDLRMDLRHGPALHQIRTNANSATTPSPPPLLLANGNEPWTIHDSDTPRLADIVDSTDGNVFFRGHVDLQEIVRRAMNPMDPILARGNFGRYNFYEQRNNNNNNNKDDDAGENNIKDNQKKEKKILGTFQTVRVGPVGSIVSLPGAADQAIHADCPHLFDCGPHLPPHYVNAFLSLVSARHAPRVGQTALVHGSHTLQTAAQYQLYHHDDNDKDDNNDDKNEDWTDTTAGCSHRDKKRKSWKPDLVRPALEVGDVLLFDCRILHFGLANLHESIERPVLYTNMTMHWFHDPKNWDNARSIFPELWSSLSR